MRIYLMLAVLLVSGCAMHELDAPLTATDSGPVLDAAIDLGLDSSIQPEDMEIDSPIEVADQGIDAGSEAGDTGVDLGPPDLGPPDLGPPDLGPPDLGPPDLGFCLWGHLGEDCCGPLFGTRWCNDGLTCRECTRPGVMKCC